jgi:hypothetical protein
MGRVKPLKRQGTEGRRNPSLRPFAIHGGDLPGLALLKSEVMDMWDVLLGNRPPPINSTRTDAMMETADAYFARASYITAMIQRAEQEGKLKRGDAYVSFRSGELRTFMDVAKRSADMGSRRVTVKGQQLEAERLGRDSRFNG